MLYCLTHLKDEFSCPEEVNEEEEEEEVDRELVLQLNENQLGLYQYVCLVCFGYDIITISSVVLVRVSGFSYNLVLYNIIFDFGLKNQSFQICLKNLLELNNDVLTMFVKWF